MGALAAFALTLTSAAAAQPPPSDVGPATFEAPQVEGALGADAVTRGIGPARVRIGECVRRDRSGRWYAHTLHLQISPEGRLTRVELDRSVTASSPRLERCVRAAMRRLRFDRADGPTTARQTFYDTVAQLAGVLGSPRRGSTLAEALANARHDDDRLVAGPPTPDPLRGDVRLRQVSVSGTPNGEPVGIALSRQHGALRTCWDRSLRDRGEAVGTLSFTFTLDASGPMSAFAVTRDDLQRRSLAACFEAALRAIRVERSEPAPASAIVHVSYALLPAASAIRSAGPGTPIRDR